MDLLTLGIDAAVIGGIIGITQVVKTYGRAKLVNAVVLSPRGLGAVAGVALGSGLPWGQIVTKVIIYTGAATYIYKFGKSVLQSA